MAALCGYPVDALRLRAELGCAVNWAKWYRGCMWGCGLLLVVEVSFGRYPQALLTLACYFYALYEWRKALHNGPETD